MAMHASSVQGVITSSSRKECWVESLVLGLGIPAAIWVVSRVISASIPAAVHGSPEQRFFLWFSAGVIVKMAVRDRALVCSAPAWTFFRRFRSLAFGDMASLGPGANACSSVDR